MTNEELIEEVKRYYSENFDYISSDQPTLSILTNVASHFAEWQKEQMMKEAVEGTVYGNGDYTWVAGDIPSQFKYGDKVRIIVCKNED